MDVKKQPSHTINLVDILTTIMCGLNCVSSPEYRSNQIINSFFHSLVFFKKITKSNFDENASFPRSKKKRWYKRHK